MCERRVFEFFCQIGFFELVQLQGEEQQIAGDLGGGFADVLLKAPGFRLRAIGGEQQRGKRRKAAENLLDRFIFRDRGGQFMACQQGELAGMASGEAGGATGGIRQIGPQFRAFGAGIKIGQIPNRQRIT